jgi:UDP-N-acetylmuramoyl-L-alanyl-D-glutamate--2,6-diaminopimelate ligase
VTAPGRLERVPDPRDVAVLVDYAHTPDALARALAALRPVTPGRLIVVFGCGGDRDRGKRPRMGEAAARGADLCVVTSDNPRTEDAASIVEAIVPGVVQGGKPELDATPLRDASSGYVAIVDRAMAIDAALRAARTGDTVLIAGKGHEDYQIVGTEKRHFDDREVAREAIARHAGEG